MSDLPPAADVSGADEGPDERATDPSDERGAEPAGPEDQAPAARPWYSRRWLRWGLTFWVAVAGLGLLAGPIVKVWRWRLFPRRWGVVDEGRIYRSGQLSKWLIEDTLRDNRIDVIVTLMTIDTRFEDIVYEERVCKKLGLRTERFAMPGDGRGSAQQYAGAIAAMVQASQAGRRVLVHCYSGTQRTGGVVACYRILVQGWPPTKAREEMAEYGWSDGDRPVLLVHLNRHMGELARLLVAQGVIPRVPDPLPQFDLGE